MKVPWIKKGSQGKNIDTGAPVPEWDYYLERHFAWLPKMYNGGGVFPAICWLCWWYETYPVDADGKAIEMYRNISTKDPRKRA